MNQHDLLALRAKIESKVTGIKLSDVDLVKETLLQLQYAKILQQDATEDTPVNQRAQVQNSIANILGNLAKVQEQLYSSEALKRLQAAVVKVVKTLPVEQQNQFFELLEIEVAAAEASMEA